MITGRFADKDSIVSQFEVEHLDFADIKYAAYWDDYGYGSGIAFVFYRDNRDGLYYEVNASNCSCYGLEGQWSPEQVEPMEIVNRPFLRLNVRQLIAAELGVPLDAIKE